MTKWMSYGLCANSLPERISSLNSERIEKPFLQIVVKAWREAFVPLGLVFFSANSYT